MKGTSCVRQVRFGSFRGQSVPPLCSATSGCKSHCSGCMDVYVVLQNAMQWLHECYMGLVLGRKPEQETLHFSV